MDREFVDGVLARVRSHGLRWSVRDMHRELARKIKSPGDLDGGDVSLRVNAVAFLVCGLGHERYEAVSGIVRNWLLAPPVEPEKAVGAEACCA